MEFFQQPPSLGNQFLEDRVLRGYLARTLPESARAEMEPSLVRVGELAGGRLLDLSRRHGTDLPQLIQYDPWGKRVDEVRFSPAWTEMARVACEEGLVALPYERQHGPYSRIHQFALVYLFNPSSLSYGCPLAMTDGAAKVLVTMGSPDLRERILPRLIDRDPARAWTSGQWMTERTGGSDVGTSTTVARLTADGWRLFGSKWFTSAVTSDIALTLARPEGNPGGGKGLALFLLHVRDGEGRLNGIRIDRLKDKLGTRVLPTAELTLDGALAEPVCGLTDGVRNITSMLNITRLWNAVDAAAVMRRGIALARDYAAKRTAFGAPLSEQPLHLEMLAALQAELEAAFHLAFEAAFLLGEEESGILGGDGRKTLRLLLPVAKLVTARQAVAAASEVLECFGGAGYIEDTGLPALLRDAQVLRIWEGTTDVLSLDALRAIDREGALDPFLKHAVAASGTVRDPGLQALALSVPEDAARLGDWEQAVRGSAQRQAGARLFALELGRLMQLSLLLRQAQWEMDHLGDESAAAAARRFRLQVGLERPGAGLPLEETRMVALQKGVRAAVRAAED